MVQINGQVVVMTTGTRKAVGTVLSRANGSARIKLTFLLCLLCVLPKW